MNVDSQKREAGSILSWYTALYHVRQKHPVLATGTFRLLSKAGDPVLAFSRSDAKATAVVAVNVSDAPQAVRLDTGIRNAAFTQSFKAPDGDLPPAVRSDGAGQVAATLAPKSVQVLVSAKN
jgi:maltose alpha-D-glucosyltransferase/alpha-amylase